MHAWEKFQINNLSFFLNNLQKEQNKLNEQWEW